MRLASIEAMLSEGEPFGSYDYIGEKLSAVYTQLLAILAEESPAAKVFLSRLDNVGDKSRRIVFRDPIIRRTIEDGVCATLQGLDTIDPATLDQLLAAVVENDGTASRTLLDGAIECVPLAYSSPSRARYVWADDQPRALPGKRFVGEVLKRLPGFRIEVPTADQVKSLVAGVHLASRVVPRLTRSALSHVFMVLVGELEGQEGRFNAATIPGLPGVIFVAPKALSDSANAAETLIHEALHLKFLDIDYIHPLFHVGYRGKTSPRITPVWHQGSRNNGDWPIDRLLTSMHVYVALAVVFEMANARPDAELRGPDYCMERAAECLTRAGWLFDEAQNHLDVLTEPGRHFVSSIGVALRELCRHRNTSSPSTATPNPRTS